MSILRLKGYFVIVAIFSHKKHHLSVGMNQFKYLSKYILQLDGANLYLIYEDFKHAHGFCQCTRLFFNSLVCNL